MDYIRAGITSLQNHIRESLDVSEKRNVLASLAAGLLVSIQFIILSDLNDFKFELTSDIHPYQFIQFFSGWWIIIDVGARYTAKDFYGAYYILGIFGTISFIIVNSISNSQLREDGFDSFNPRAAKGCLLLGFILGFSALTGSVWILISDYAASDKDIVKYPGVALLIQNILIFLSSLTFKFGRVED